MAVISLHLPPLRERKTDIPLIAQSLLGQINTQFRQQEHSEPGYKDKTLSATATAFVKNYPWPGNIRQLQNALLQAAVMADGDTIDRGDIQAAVGNLDLGLPLNPLEHAFGDGFDLEEHLKSMQRHYLRRAMQESRGHGSKGEEFR